MAMSLVKRSSSNDPSNNDGQGSNKTVEKGFNSFSNFDNASNDGTREVDDDVSDSEEGGPRLEEGMI